MALQPGQHLDMSSLPTKQAYVCGNETTIDMADFVSKFRSAIDELAASGLIKTKTSLGIAFGEPIYAELMHKWDWDEPKSFVWFYGGWGPEMVRFAANAVRKLRPLLRINSDTDLQDSWPTLEMIVLAGYDFSDEAESEDEGRYPWGDYPWGGATIIRIGNLTIPVAVSALHQGEDHAIAELFGMLLAKKILVGDGLISA